VRVLTAPGRTVRGSSDPRIAPVGSIHVVLVDHPHTDHLGNVYDNNCAATSQSPLLFPTEGNAPEIAARNKSAVLVGGEMNSFFTQKILNINGGAAPGGCNVSGLDNTFSVPMAAPCVTAIRGGTLTASINGQPGVKITTIPAWHGAGVPRALIDPPGVPVGMTGYAGSETGYIIRFTNGLTVLWTGDSGLIGDWATQSQFYGVNLAVVHMGDVNTMGPSEAAWAINNLIKPNMVIVEHANQVSTIGGQVVSGTRVEAFISQVKHGSAIVPLSGVPIVCDGQAHCRQHQ
jgi:L-ascorbate metabolism protein UlaG (beta-lactamase superfamily)